MHFEIMKLQLLFRHIACIDWNVHVFFHVPIIGTIYYSYKYILPSDTKRRDVVLYWISNVLINNYFLVNAWIYCISIYFNALSCFFCDSRIFIFFRPILNSGFRPTRSYTALLTSHYIDFQKCKRFQILFYGKIMT